MTDERYPWYPWYVAEYRASRNVQRLSITQRGIYRELLDECWVKGFVPDNVIELARISNVSVSVMSKAWPALRPLFVSLPGLDGECLTSARMEVERAKRDTMREKKVAAGKASAVSRNTRSTGVQHRSTNTAQHNTTQALVTQAAELPTAISDRPVRTAGEWKRLLETSGGPN